MTSQSDFTDREIELIRMLTERYPDRALDARVVTVHRQEGGESETLRLTLDDAISTDFARERVANMSQSIEALTDEAEAELEAPGAAIGP